MSINYTISADIYDISTDVPQKEDIIFVDTNVWFWLTYTKASQVTSTTRSISSYITYINRALSISALLIYSPLVYAELAHTIAKSELDLFCSLNSSQIKLKEFRNNYPTEWNNAINEINTAIGQIKCLGVPLSPPPDEKFMEEVCKCQKSYGKHLDIYDIIYVKQMESERISKIITDDGDFSTIPNINMFTSNRNVLTLAQSARRLKCR